MTPHPSPGGPHIDKCISPNTIRMTLCLGEKRFYVLSICYTHLDKILLANVKQGYLFERSTLTFLPVAENTHLKFFFFGHLFRVVCLYRRELKCCCKEQIPFFSLKRIIEAFYGSAVYSNLCFYKKK